MRQIVLSLLLVTPSIASAEQSKKACVLTEYVKITEVEGAIEISGHPPRLSRVRVSTPVDCKSGVALRPQDKDEAVGWLDSSLPLDLKAALLHGEYAEPYATSNYGASVMDDLFRYYSSRWALKSDSASCSSPDIKRRVATGAGSCFYALVDILRDTYLAGAGRR